MNISSYVFIYICNINHPPLVALDEKYVCGHANGVVETDAFGWKYHRMAMEGLAI